MATAEIRDQFGALSLGPTFSADKVTIADSASSTHDDGQENEADPAHDDSYAERWKEATRRAQVGLSPADLQTVSQYDDPDKLLKGLEGMKSTISGVPPEVLADVFWQLHKAQPFRDVIKLFAVVMLPHSVPTGIVWGLIYVAIQLSTAQEVAAKRFADMLQKIREQLAILKKSSAAIEKASGESSELRRSYLSIFEALIYFWRDCIKYFRKHPPINFNPLKTKQWVDVQTSFSYTMEKISNALLHLERFLDTPTGTQQSVVSQAGVGSSIPPLIHIPNHQASVFIGRDEVRDDMDQFFDGCKDKDNLAIFTLYGIGGVGKTEIAMQYARYYIHRHKGEFDAVLWFCAETTEQLRNTFTRAAVELRLQGADINGKPERNLDLVHLWLKAARRRWLLIFDNVEAYKDIQDYLPTGARGDIIITTRYEPVAMSVQSSNKCCRTVPKLDKMQSQALFLQLLFSADSDGDGTKHPGTSLEALSEGDQDAVKFLLHDMDGLALGIRQLASIIKYRELTDIANFAGQYKKYLPQILDNSEGIEGHTLQTLWKVTFESIQDKPDAKTMLGLLCCLDPDSIPKELFLPSDRALATGRLEFCQEEFEVDGAASILRRIGLIEQHKNILTIHRLVQVAYLFHIKSDEQQTMFNYASILVNHLFPKQIKGRQLYEKWAQCQKWIQHGASLAALFGKFRDAKVLFEYTRPFVELMENCAWYMYEAGNRQGTIDLVTSGVNACGENDELGRAHLLNSKGLTYFFLNDLVQCREALAESQSIRERLLSSADEELANTYLNLGNLEAAEGRHDLAIPFFEKSMSTRQSIVGAEGMVAVCHLTIARALLNKGDFKRAGEKMDESQKIFEQCFGEKAYNHLFVHYARGNLHLAVGDMAKARESFQTTLDMQLEWAPHMLKVAAIYFKLGTVHFHLGEYEEALKDLAKGLEVARSHKKDGKGEAARNLRRQAQILEIAMPRDDSSLLDLADDRDPLVLRGTAEKLRFEQTVDPLELFQSLVVQVQLCSALQSSQEVHMQEELIDLRMERFNAAYRESNDEREAVKKDARLKEWMEVK
ncbi:hypothetical protein CEP51_001902 [Fusarium floridanum]|uniref:Uncharacterized protein n=1 Tax=Fusarium floridanum TaxID=1325733 RepID=A0A428SE06_9HYPO|nr:hypothetical protein CEP51_001902 [Fusarium floridanum]